MRDLVSTYVLEGMLVLDLDGVLQAVDVHTQRKRHGRQGVNHR